MTLPGMLSPRQFSLASGVPETLLARWRCDRRVLKYVKIGGQVFYYEADAKNLIERHTVKVDAKAV